MSSDINDGSEENPPEAWHFSHVLSTKSFPLSSTLRWRSTHRCSCASGERHRSLFDFNQLIGADHLLFGKPFRPVKVCWNSMNLMEDLLPRDLTGLDKRVLFEDLPNVRTMTRVLNSATYWYRRFSETTEVGLPSRKLVGLLSLLSGKPVSTHTTELLGSVPSKTGVARFKQIIATVDGFLMQVMLAYPDKLKFQNWNFVDRAINCLMSNLVSDYLPGHKPSYISVYEKLKKLRKSAKFNGFSEILKCSDIPVPRELSMFRPVLDGLDEGSKTVASAIRVGLFCQTRACGTPPPHMKDKALIKFIDTITEPAEAPRAPNSIYWATVNALHEIEFHAFDFEKLCSTALSRMKVSLSDSAELNCPRSSGGKYEAARRLLAGVDRVQVIDLATGKDTGRYIERSANNFGEMLFYISLAHLRDGSLSGIMDLRAETVTEAGKARVVTISHICHAVILHPLSHLCSEIIAAHPAHTSGMKASNNAWNFFKRLSHKNPAAGFLFSPNSIFVLSSDLETATDFCNPHISRLLLTGFLGKDGIGVPPWYLNVSLFLLTSPRSVTVTGRILEPFDKVHTTTFKSKRGAFMGDPLTKSLMHLCHMSSSYLAKEWMRKYPLQSGIE